MRQPPSSRAAKRKQGLGAEQMGSDLLSTIVENVKRQPSNKAFSAEDLGPVVKGGFLEEVGLGVSWD